MYLFGRKIQTDLAQAQRLFTRNTKALTNQIQASFLRNHATDHD